ncbi:PaaI family thioesterase [Sphingomonas sp. MMS12-HWE2-04]|uniref:PaaI family thioesterase n=1 Tax=Sphingomonas sp. MMS12-HWE2-04 TaxID=3234199 RepID=UPI00384DD9D1
MMPPYADLLGISLEPGETAPTLLLPFGDHLLGRPAFLHGGAIGGLLEMAAIAALKQALGDDSNARIKPINLTVDYMRGGRDKLTRARGHVTRLGNRVANVEARAWQDEPDRPIAAARINFLIAR